MATAAHPWHWQFARVSIPTGRTVARLNPFVRFSTPAPPCQACHCLQVMPKWTSCSNPTAYKSMTEIVVASSSADLQSALSQNCILHFIPSLDREFVERLADYKSAIRQIANLRY